MSAPAPLPPRKDPWISVDEGLPGEGECVLVWCKWSAAQEPAVAYLEDRHWKLEWDGRVIGDPAVTHWMPLPDPPTSA